MGKFGFEMTPKGAVDRALLKKTAASPKNQGKRYLFSASLTCKNGDDEFRPDITLLINGMPLAFIEVKKPNNREGVLAERNRIITRSRNTKFRGFINITHSIINKYVTMLIRKEYLP